MTQNALPGPPPCGEPHSHTRGQFGLTLWRPGRRVISQDDLLRELEDRPITQEIKVIYIVGAHRFQERELLLRLFPKLEQVHLFEPLPKLFKTLEKETRGDPRIKVFPYAISDADGVAEFYVASGDSASSSLLRMGRHREIFPKVREVKTIAVQTRRLATVMAEHRLAPPDFLFLDVQGAEYRILSTLSPAARTAIKLIYTEASTEEVYTCAKNLDDLKHLLTPEYVFLGFAPLENGTPSHGNALFALRSVRDRLILPHSSVYKVTAIVSTYNAEHLLPGCLADLEAQTIADRLEIIVVDSGSPQNERSIVAEFQRRSANLVYVRTEIRETLYAAWNRAIKIARGRYLTNANTDDRHAPEALEKLARALDDHPDAGVAYATTAITETENTTLAQGPVTGCFRARAFDRRRLFRECLPGPQPMWRRELHERFGYFDETFFSAGDYEFWLRLSAEVRFLHLPEVLGLFLKSPDSLMHRNAERAAREAKLARDRYWPREWGRRPPNSQFWLDRLTRRSTYKAFGRGVMKLLSRRVRD